MSEVTLELVQARQAELAQLIEQLKRGPVVNGSQIIVAEANAPFPSAVVVFRPVAFALKAWAPEAA